MTIRELYDLNRNSKHWVNNNSEDFECVTSLPIEFIIEDSATGEFPFCSMYEIRQNKIYASGTEKEHIEIWDCKVKTYFIETDYQDSSLVRLRIKI